MEIQKFFGDMLLKQYDEITVNNIIQGLSLQKQVTLRINTIKSNKDEIKEELNKENIIFKDVSWYEDALIIQNAREEQIQKLDIYEQGKIYLQSLSSMLPPIVLNPQENENKRRKNKI